MTVTIDQLPLDELRDRLRTHDVELPSFTSAELRVAAPSVLADRYVKAPDEAPHDAATSAELRQATVSLTARGFLEAGAPGRVKVRGTLALIAAARIRPVHFSTVTGSGPRDRVHLWRLPRTDVVVHERVTGDVHRFVLRSTGRAGAALAAMATPPGDGHDTVEVLDASDAHELIAAADERFRVESLTTGEVGPAYGHLTVLVHATGALVVSADVSKDEPTAAVTRASSASALATLLATWLREPELEVAP